MAKKTQTALAPKGLKSKDGVSPSGFTLAEHVTPEDYSPRAAKPRFLNIMQASETPCHGCHAECCRARVVINVADLVRLSAPLQVPPYSLCDLTEADTRNGEPIMIGDTKKHMILRKGADDFCALMLNVDGHRKCGVHGIRPAICRIYPFSFERGQTRYQMGFIMCPTMWLVSPERRDAILDDVESHEHDRALDRKLVREFNERPVEERTPSEFWRFALREGAKELGYDVSWAFKEAPRRKLKAALW